MLQYARMLQEEKNHMKCKDCPYFKLVMKPIKHVYSGLARCLKHDLVVDLVSMRQINRLKCVEEEQEKEQ